jgi:flavin-dependent dehydrogenase
VSRIRRDGGAWIVNDSIRTDLIVGAGGHFCPVARWMNPQQDSASLVVAQEVEMPIRPDDSSAWTAEPGVPELYFSRDMSGYGWCFRKGEYVNIGFGCLRRGSLPKALAEFAAFLRAHGRVPKVPDAASGGWRGHAYLVSGPSRRRAIDSGLMLVGDAAGIAYPQSGEGIRPAIESGLLAASTIIEAEGLYSRDRLQPYDEQLQQRFGDRPAGGIVSSVMVSGVAATLLPWLLGTRWFTRHLVLDRWFLHAHDPALVVP